MNEREYRTLDWRRNWDDRNRLFRFAALDCFSVGTTKGSTQRTKQVFLDQGSEGACTGFGAANVMALTPRQWLSLTDQDAREIYYEARRQDEWEGEAYEGSSVNGAMKALRLFNDISAWHWCLSISEVLHALSYHGPVEAGTDWYEGMWEPDDMGFLNVTGSVVGGHAWALSGFKQTTEGTMFRMENSWGRSWGVDGGAWIHLDDLQKLMVNGEFACPVKVKP